MPDENNKEHFALSATKKSVESSEIHFPVSVLRSTVRNTLPTEFKVESLERWLPEDNGISCCPLEGLEPHAER